MSRTIEILKKPQHRDTPVPVFSMVRNEAYFLPHFLRHYRALGVREFWFLDDRSTDGTPDLIRAEPDCGLLASPLGYGDRVGSLPFGTVVKTVVGQNLFRGRWSLLLDADEFLLLPSCFADFPSLALALDRQCALAARVVVLDFFPKTLGCLDAARPDASPFEVCPYFDPLPVEEWRDGEDRRTVDRRQNVRFRMFQELRRRFGEIDALIDNYRHPQLTKYPMLRWRPGTQAFEHSATHRPTDRVQIALAHFKFYPGFRARIADALATRAHWQASTEYRFLDIATRELADWSLCGPQSLRYEGEPGLMERAGATFSRL